MEKYKKGQKIVSIGDKLEYVGIVKSGVVKIYKQMLGREIVVADMGMFELWSKMMVITGGKSDYLVEAMGPVEIVKTTKDTFLKELENDSKKQMALIQGISELFLDQVRRTTDIIGTTAMGKVAAVVLSMANEGYPLTHKLIANLTGLTRETVTLQMLKMEKMKLLDNSNRRVKILDKKGLEKVVG